MRTTHTYAMVPVSKSTFYEIKKTLEDAGYEEYIEESFNEEPKIIMQGLAIQPVSWCLVPHASLTFKELRKANQARLPHFKNAQGKSYHNKTDGEEWTVDQWFKAVVGELGEFANISKKFDRGDMHENDFKFLAAKELADVQCYLDILALRLGIDLGEATREKFNEVSERVGSSVKL